MNINLQKSNLSEELEEKLDIIIDLESEIVGKIKFLKKHKLINIDLERLDWWLENFRSNTIHRLFSLIVLDSLIYRSYEMLNKSILRCLIKDIKPIYEEIQNVEFTVMDWIEKLKLDKSLKIKFYGVNKDNNIQSSNIILRNLHTIVHNSHLIVNDTQLTHNIRSKTLIVILDDIIGSGEQFSKYFKRLVKAYPEIDENKIIYVPLMATQKGIDKIKTCADLINKPIKIFPCEIIDLEKHILSSDTISKFKNILDFESNYDFLELFIDMNKDFPFIKSNWLGWDEAKLAFINEWGCPNQTVAMVYHDENEIPTSTITGNNSYFYLLKRRGCQ